MATFQIIESIVGAFGGFAQMLESTFMATHSSFFAMIGVAEQLSHLRNYLGQVLSLFTVVRWIQGLLGKDQGTRGMTADEFRKFELSPGTRMDGKKPRPSKKPIIIFLLTVIGIPWAMIKVVKLISARQEEEMRQRIARGEIPPSNIPIGQGEVPNYAIGMDGQPYPIASVPSPPQTETIDPSTLTFVRAVHPYNPTSEGEGETVELRFQENDIIAVLTPKNERIEPGWWRGRLRDGRIGWFPSTYVSELPMGGKLGAGEKVKK